MALDEGSIHACSRSKCERPDLMPGFTPLDPAVTPNSAFAYQAANGEGGVGLGEDAVVEGVAAKGGQPDADGVVGPCSRLVVGLDPDIPLPVVDNRIGVEGKVRL